MSNNTNNIPQDWKDGYSELRSKGYPGSYEAYLQGRKDQYLSSIPQPPQDKMEVLKRLIAFIASDTYPPEQYSLKDCENYAEEIIKTPRAKDFISKLFSPQPANEPVIEPTGDRLLDLGSITVYKDMPEDVKQQVVERAVTTAAQILLYAFHTADLQTHIDTTVVNQATGIEYILSFKRKDVLHKAQAIRNELWENEFTKWHNNMTTGFVYVANPPLKELINWIKKNIIPNAQVSDTTGDAK